VVHCKTFHFSSTSGKQWIQVDFQEPHIITGILTQGVPDADRWLTQYAILYSKDGLSFTPYSDKVGGTAKLFKGNADRDSIVKHMLERIIEARYVRIVVVEGGSAGIGLRFNLIGCYG